MGRPAAHARALAAIHHLLNLRMEARRWDQALPDRSRRSRSQEWEVDDGRRNRSRTRVFRRRAWRRGLLRCDEERPGEDRIQRSGANAQGLAGALEDDYELPQQSQPPGHKFQARAPRGRRRHPRRPKYSRGARRRVPCAQNARPLGRPRDVDRRAPAASHVRNNDGWLQSAVDLLESARLRRKDPRSRHRRGFIFRLHRLPGQG